MEICPNPAKRRCDIWLTHAEGSEYRKSPEIQSVCQQYRRLGYQVCVYVGGSEPLLPNVTALLDWQTNRLQ